MYRENFSEAGKGDLDHLASRDGHATLRIEANDDVMKMLALLEGASDGESLVLRPENRFRRCLDLCLRSIRSGVSGCGDL